MKKHIVIPKVSGVFIAVVLEENIVYGTDEWNVYVFNEKNIDLEMVVVVCKGFNNTNKTSTIRKKIDILPANSFAKVEMIQPELFELNNLFQVSFFENNRLLEKTFLFPSNSIHKQHLKFIPSIKQNGILSK